MNSQLISEVLASLGVLLLEYRHDSFYVLGITPPWFKRLAEPILEGSIVNLPETFPPLTNFLADANGLWSQKTSEPSMFSEWTENDLSGNEYNLSAYTLWIGRTRLMLISQMDEKYIQTLQAYRKTKLEHEGLKPKRIISK